MGVSYENPASLGVPLGKYSHFSRAGDLVAVAGQVGVRADGSLAGDDLPSQLRQVFDNLRLVLEAAGGDLGNVMKLTTYLAASATVDEFRAARDEVYAELYPDGRYPPNTLVVIERLVRPELHVEVDALASIPQ